MLTKINEGYVISDEGFKVKLGRHHISYIENNGYATTFETEDTLNPYTLIIYFSAKESYWHPPYESEKLSIAELGKIKSRFISVLDFLKINYEII